ncbi:MAG TPA: response regulator, partial [Gemmatimonadaceae bacterium]|nr:response regulator [Gemmatimonadaceae bacterium]
MAGQTALVIDDESQIRRAVSHALADDFAKVAEAATGVEGLAFAISDKPALIVLDLGLPDMSGLSLCAEIRKSS